MTTFLHTHSWLNWVDENDDEVGLKEKPEDTRYIKKIEIRPEAPGVRAKDFIPTFPIWGLRTRESAGASHLKVPKFV